MQVIGSGKTGLGEYLEESGKVSETNGYCWILPAFSIFRISSTLSNSKAIATPMPWRAVNLWWFEFALLQIREWTFGLYFVLICYSVVFVMLAVMLFPDAVLVPGGFREYFNGYGRRFYAIVIGMVIIDTLDTLIKGPAYYRRMYGVDYPVRQVLLAAGAAGGLVIRSERYHALFVVVALLFQIAWIIGLFGVIGSN
jgi:hypothetical protein